MGIQPNHAPLGESQLMSTAHLDDVGAYMEALCRGETSCALGEIARQHLATGGKQMRARLVLAACVALGGARARAVPWAAALELVHNASLIHDDLQDGDEQRRGQPTVWARHGAAQAINAGDLLLSAPYRAVVKTAVDDATRWRLCESMAYAVERMCRGQSSELEMAERLARTARLEAAYLQCARDKTGALFGACIEGAALIAGIPQDDARALGISFLSLGILFQVQDDILDLFGEKGRDKRGNDLREGKVSALVVEHLARHPGDRAWLHDLLQTPRQETSDEAVAEAIARFAEGGALEGCLFRMATLAEQLITDSHRLASPAFAALSASLVRQVLNPIACVLEQPTLSLSVSEQLDVSRFSGMEMPA